MRSGTIDCQISVEQKSITRDPSYNTEIVTWAPLVAAPGSPVIAERWWAQVQDTLPSRSEAVKQGIATASRQTRVRMRYRNDIDSSMRVTIHQDTSVVYQIISGPVDVTNEGRKRMIEFVCEKFSTTGEGL